MKTQPFTWTVLVALITTIAMSCTGSDAESDSKWSKAKTVAGHLRQVLDTYRAAHRKTWGDVKPGVYSAAELFTHTTGTVRGTKNMPAEYTNDQARRVVEAVDTLVGFDFDTDFVVEIRSNDAFTIFVRGAQPDSPPGMYIFELGQGMVDERMDYENSLPAITTRLKPPFTFASLQGVWQVAIEATMSLDEFLAFANEKGIDLDESEAYFAIVRFEFISLHRPAVLIRKKDEIENILVLRLDSMQGGKIAATIGIGRNAESVEIAATDDANQISIKIPSWPPIILTPTDDPALPAAIIHGSRRRMTRSSMKSVADSIERFVLHVNRLPQSLDELQTGPANHPERWRPLLSGKHSLLDAWGRPYDYEIIDAQLERFRLRSLGADEKPGGEGENADMELAPE